MTPPRIIGITGYAQHGKDTTAGILVDRYGYEQYAFATPLKSIALVLNPIIAVPHNDSGIDFVKSEPCDYYRLRDYVDAVGWEEAKKNGEVRRFLQVLGTEGAREHLGSDVWLRAMEVQTKGKLTDGRSKIVISDVRFPNEADFIKEIGGDVWRVMRLEVIDGVAGNYDNGLGTEHGSEKHIASLRADVIVRAFTIEDLEEEVDRCFGKRSERTPA